MAILHRPNSLNNRTPRQVVANFTILEIAIKSCLFIHVISLQVIYFNVQQDPVTNQKSIAISHVGPQKTDFQKYIYI